MIEREFFALRHTETGLIMPLFPHNRGYTNWEPIQEQAYQQSLPNRGAADVPRLFPTRNGAVQARSKWAEGIHVARYVGEGGDEFFSVDIKEALFARKVEDLKIVTIRIMENEDG